MEKRDHLPVAWLVVARYDAPERAVLAIAAGTWDERRTADWLRASRTEVREMTPGLGDLRRGGFDFAQRPRRALILPIHLRRNPKDR